MTTDPIPEGGMPPPAPDFRALCARLAELDGHYLLECTEEYADVMACICAALEPPLSPAAQAVFDAADGMEPRKYRGKALAAALRAVADQVCPQSPCRTHILAIANELDQP
jgi:hypothetical protein